MIESIKDTLKICNSAVYFDYENIVIIIQLNILRASIFDNFLETVPKSKISEAKELSMI